MLRDADVRGVADLHHLKRNPSASLTGRWLGRAGPAGTRSPGVLPAMYAVMARSVAARQRIGTVAVTAVGMPGGGWARAHAADVDFPDVVIGGMSQRPL
jgi:hypothetical protein